MYHKLEKNFTKCKIWNRTKWNKTSIFSFFSSNAFVYGGEDKMEISAEIINRGEDAFNAMLYLQLPKEINYMSVESNTPGLSVLCSPPSPINNRTLQCDVGNPLPANTQAIFLII